MKHHAAVAASLLVLSCGAEKNVKEDPNATEASVAEAPATSPQSQGGHHHHHHHGEHEMDGSHVSHEAPMDHRFDDPERWAKVFDDPERDAWQKPDEVVAKMELAAGMVVADIGAGTGYFLGRLSKGVGPDGKVWGLDIEQSMVDHMTERAAKSGWGNVAAKTVAPDDPGLEPASADRVLIVDTWHHIADRVEYTKKIAAGLKPGGRLYVVDFELDSHRGPPAKHKLAAETIISELEQGGLKAEIVAETLPDQYIVVGSAKGGTQK